MTQTHSPVRESSEREQAVTLADLVQLSPAGSDRPVMEAKAHFNESDLMDLYLQDVRQDKLLTAEEEVRLAQAIEAGTAAAAKLAAMAAPADDRADQDPDTAELVAQVRLGRQARDHLIRANRRLVISIAKRYRGRNLAFLDLIQEGNIGLVTATDKFDYRRGNRFSTYATWWIRQAISRAIANTARPIRLPVHQTDRLQHIFRAQQELQQLTGRQPTVAELAAEVNVAPAAINQLLNVSQHPLSLEMPVNGDGEMQLGDLIPDESATSPPEEVGARLLVEQVAAALERLSPQEATVLRLRFGLQADGPRSLKEIGELFDLSRERIRQIEKQAILRLRAQATLAHLPMTLG